MSDAETIAHQQAEIEALRQQIEALRARNNVEFLNGEEESEPGDGGVLVETPPINPFSNVPPPEYHGNPDESFVAWKAQFRNYMTVCRANPRVVLKTAKACLKGTALMWLASIPEDQQQDFESFIAALERMARRYEDPGTSYDIALSRKQKAGQSVMEFHTKVEGSLGRLFEAGSESYKQLSKKTFLDGLLPDIRSKMANYHATLEAALNEARYVEAQLHKYGKLGSTTVTNINDPASIGNVSASDAKTGEVRALLRELLELKTAAQDNRHQDRSRLNNRRDTRAKVRGDCYSCGKPGHRAADCYSKRPVNGESQQQIRRQDRRGPRVSDSRNSLDGCFTCGEPGHMAFQCPTKGRITGNQRGINQRINNGSRGGEQHRESTRNINGTYVAQNTTEDLLDNMSIDDLSSHLKMLKEEYESTDNCQYMIIADLDSLTESDFSSFGSKLEAELEQWGAMSDCSGEGSDQEDRVLEWSKSSSKDSEWDLKDIGLPQWQSTPLPWEHIPLPTGTPEGYGLWGCRDFELVRDGERSKNIRKEEETNFSQSGSQLAPEVAIFGANPVMEGANPCLINMGLGVCDSNEVVPGSEADENPTRVRSLPVEKMRVERVFPLVTTGHLERAIVETYEQFKEELGYGGNEIKNLSHAVHLADVHAQHSNENRGGVLALLVIHAQIRMRGAIELLGKDYWAREEIRRFGICAAWSEQESNQIGKMLQDIYQSRDKLRGEVPFYSMSLSQLCRQRESYIGIARENTVLLKVAERPARKQMTPQSVEVSRGTGMSKETNEKGVEGEPDRSTSVETEKARRDEAIAVVGRYDKVTGYTRKNGQRTTGGSSLYHRFWETSSVKISRARIHDSSRLSCAAAQDELFKRPFPVKSWEMTIEEVESVGQVSWLPCRVASTQNILHKQKCVCESCVLEGIKELQRKNKANELEDFSEMRREALRVIKEANDKRHYLVEYARFSQLDFRTDVISCFACGGISHDNEHLCYKALFEQLKALDHKPQLHHALLARNSEIKTFVAVYRVRERPNERLEIIEETKPVIAAYHLHLANRHQRDYAQLREQGKFISNATGNFLCGCCLVQWHLCLCEPYQCLCYIIAPASKGTKQNWCKSRYKNIQYWHEAEIPGPKFEPQYQCKQQEIPDDLHLNMFFREPASTIETGKTVSVANCVSQTLMTIFVRCLSLLANLLLLFSKPTLLLLFFVILHIGGNRAEKANEAGDILASAATKMGVHVSERFGVMIQPEGLIMATARKAYLPLIIQVAPPHWTAPPKKDQGYCKHPNCHLDGTRAKSCAGDRYLRAAINTVQEEAEIAYRGVLDTPYYHQLLNNLCEANPDFCPSPDRSRPRRKRFLGVLFSSLLGLTGTGISIGNSVHITQLSGKVTAIAQATRVLEQRTSLNSKLIEKLTEANHHVYAFMHHAVHSLTQLLDNVRCVEEQYASVIQQELMSFMYSQAVKQTVDAVLHDILHGSVSPGLVDVTRLTEMFSLAPETQGTILEREPSLVYQFGRIYSTHPDFRAMRFSLILEVPIPTESEVFPYFQVLNLGWYEKWKETAIRLPLPKYLVRRGQVYSAIDMNRCRSKPGVSLCGPEALFRSQFVECLSLVFEPNVANITKGCMEYSHVSTWLEHTKVAVSQAGVLFLTSEPVYQTTSSDIIITDSSTRDHQTPANGVKFLSSTEFKHLVLKGRIITSSNEEFAFRKTPLYDKFSYEMPDLHIKPTVWTELKAAEAANRETQLLVNRTLNNPAFVLGFSYKATSTVTIYLVVGLGVIGLLSAVALLFIGQRHIKHWLRNRNANRAIPQLTQRSAGYGAQNGRLEDRRPAVMFHTLPTVEEPDDEPSFNEPSMCQVVATPVQRRTTRTKAKYQSNRCSSVGREFEASTAFNAVEHSSALCNLRIPCSLRYQNENNSNEFESVVHDTIFDSGASYTIISHELAAALGYKFKPLKYPDSDSCTGIGGHRVPILGKVMLKVTFKSDVQLATDNLPYKDVLVSAQVLHDDNLGILFGMSFVHNHLLCYTVVPSQRLLRMRFKSPDEDSRSVCLRYSPHLDGSRSTLTGKEIIDLVKRSAVPADHKFQHHVPVNSRSCPRYASTTSQPGASADCAKYGHGDNPEHIKSQRFSQLAPPQHIERALTTTPGKSYRVAVFRNTRVLARHQQLVPVYLECSFEDAYGPTSALIEPINERYAEKHLCFGRALVRPKNKLLWLPVINSGVESVQLYEDQSVGTAEPITAEDRVGYFEDSQGKLALYENPKSKNRIVAKIVLDSPRIRCEARRVEPTFDKDGKKVFKYCKDWPYELRHMDLSNAAVDDEQFLDLIALLKENKDIFASHDYDLGSCTVYQPRIDTAPDQTPVRKPPHRMPYHLRDKLKDELEEMLKAGIITPSKSAWASPVVYVKKKDGSLRLCVDFRATNAVIVQEQFPLPRIDDILAQLGKAQFFTCIDAQKGFWQLKLDPDTKHKSAFTTCWGNFEFDYLPMGLAISAGAYQRTMSIILSGIECTKAMVYLDDCLILSKDFPTHLKDLADVFDRFRQANLKLKPSKCEIARCEVPYLGHWITREGVKPSPEKIRAIKDFGQPRTDRDIMSFMGVVNYYGKFIPDLAKRALPLNKLRRKGAKFVWSTEQEAAFKDLKEALTSDSLLIYPNFDKEFVVYCDASGYALGAALSQADDNNLMRPVAYISRALKEPETRYPPYQREALALVWAVKKLDFYLHGAKHFRVVTDHQSLKYFMTGTPSNLRTLKWKMDLQGYNFTIEYRRGSQNGNADALSRDPRHRPVEWDSQEIRRGIPKHQKPDTEEIDEKSAVVCLADYARALTQAHVVTRTQQKRLDQNLVEEQRQEVEDNLRAVRKLKVVDAHQIQGIEAEDSESEEEVVDADAPPTLDPTEWNNIAELQEADRDFGHMYKYLKSDELPKDDEAARRVLLSADCFSLYNDVLFRRAKVRDEWQYRPCVPFFLRTSVMKSAHNSLGSGHFGQDKTYSRAEATYYWPKMKKDIVEWVQTCRPCQQRKSPPFIERPTLCPIPTEGKPMARMHVDILDIGVRASGTRNKYIVVFVCAFTNYTVAEPCNNITAKTVAEIFLKRVVYVYGAPIRLVSDRGTQFTGALNQWLCEWVGTKHSCTTPYAPACNGKVERLNRILLDTLSIITEQARERWDSYITYALFAYNPSIHKITGDSPFYLMHGFQANMPHDPSVVRDNIDVPPDVEDYKRETTLKVSKAWELAKQAIEKHQEKLKDLSMQKSRTHAYQPGDLVLVYYPNIPESQTKYYKLGFHWIGPYRIVQVTPPTVKLVLVGKSQAIEHKVNVKRVKPFKGTAFVSGDQQDWLEGPEDLNLQEGT